MTASKCNIFTKLSLIISVANFPIKFQIGKIGSNWKIEKIIYSTNLSSYYDQRANHALNENARLIRVYQTKRSSFLFTLTLTNYNKTRESWIFTTWSMKREIMIAELWHHFFFFHYSVVFLVTSNTVYWMTPTQRPIPRNFRLSLHPVLILITLVTELLKLGGVKKK